MLSFENITYLSALAVLLPLAGIFILAIRRKAKIKKELGDIELVEGLTRNYSSRLYNFKFFLILLALTAGILAAANLHKPAAGSSEKRAGIDIMIALDVSKSMLSEDVKPSRLELARQLVNLLMNQLGDNRIGLVLFAGRAYLQMPLTSDISAAKMYIDNASPDAVPVQGTVIGDALELCDNSLDTREKKYKAVILISDGEDHDPKSAAEVRQLYDHGVVVYTVGIGTAQGSPIIEPGTNVYKTDANGQTIISKLNEKELEDIAQGTGGQYFHLENSFTTAGELTTALGGMDKKVFAAGFGERQYESFFPFFIAFALLLLVAEIFIPETKKEKT